MTTTITLSKAAQFFYYHSAWSYNPATETPEEGRIRCALEAEKAENWAADNDVQYEWEYDDHCSSEEEGERWQCLATVFPHDDGGPISASLCNVDLGEDGRDDNYRRVVEADLAMDLMAQDKEREAAPIDERRALERAADSGDEVAIAAIADWWEEQGDSARAHAWRNQHGIMGMYGNRAVRQYLETALWASTSGEEGTPLDENFGVGDFLPSARVEAMIDVREFLSSMTHEADEWCAENDVDSDDIAHDFWLTRNGHGAGFWDGDYPKAIGEELTRLAKSFGECNVCVFRNKLQFSAC